MKEVKKDALNFAACYVYVKAKDSSGFDKLWEGGKSLFNFEAENEHVANALNAFEIFVNTELSSEKSAG